MDGQKFRMLSPRQRALVAVAVLLDGREAVEYLEADPVNGLSFKRAAMELASQGPELRMPFIGTALRAALKEMK